MLDLCKFVIHIGYQKTGSTWLQRMIFDNPCYGFPLINRRDIYHNFFYPTSFDFNPMTTRSNLERLIFKLQVPVNRPIIISEERLCGHPDSGGYDSKEIADRLHSVIPSSKIIIVIREQKDIIRSAYGEYIRFGGTEPLKFYLEGRIDYVRPRFDFRFYQYDRLIKYYRDLFGKENVFVFLYETFKTNKEKFIRDLFQLINDEAYDYQLPDFSPIYNSMSDISLEFRRLSNLFDRKKRRSINPYAFDIPVLRKLLRFIERNELIVPHSVRQKFADQKKSTIKKFVSDRYFESNKRLSKIMGINLDDWGYEINCNV